MTSENVGNDNYAEKKVEELKQKLMEYEQKLQFNVRTENNEATKLLTISRNELEKMTPEDCGYAAYALTQYVIYLQKMVNYEESVVNYCESSINFVVGKKISQYNAYSFNEKRMLAINDDTYAKEVLRLQVIAKSRVDSMAFIINKVQNLANILVNLQQSKKTNRYG